MREPVQLRDLYKSTRIYSSMSLCWPPIFLLLLISPLVTLAKSPFTLPYRAWTSWDLSAVTNAESRGYGREYLTEANVLSQSDALANSSLQKIWDSESPRTVLAIDSFWALDPTKIVDSYGRWAWNTTRFPSGFQAVSSRAQANNQRLGIYLNPGVAVAAVNAASPIFNGLNGCTCDDIAIKPIEPGNTFWDTRRINFSHPCAQTYIDSIIIQLVEWNVGLIKLDAVSPGSDDTNGIDNRLDVAAFSDAITRLNADIWLIISWRINSTYAEDFFPHANSWRTSNDVDCYCNVLSAWHAVRNRFIEVIPWLPYLPRSRENGGYPDLDSLNVLQGDFDGLTNDEKQTSATLWAMVGSPWYTGNDLTAGLDSYGVMLLTNEEVLSVNEDAMPPSLTPASMNGTADLQIWYSASSTGVPNIITVALFNLGDNTTDITLRFADVGIVSTANDNICIRDLWLREDIECLSSETLTFVASNVPTHGSRLLRIDASGGGGE